ncbi:uncharacterized protein LOC111041850 [Myzus persicae]|uniref:uncharacterized protein LOC111041850 n=1 Tax=Myzus persicae TaxID=13164 RepID=UPI000B93945D|nr:uncharacterized protein LOC111041850 [Myzus persicae]
MIKFIEKILLLLAITYSVLAAPRFKNATSQMTDVDIRIRNHGQDSLNGLLCPPIGLRHKFEVATIQTATPMYGCAYMERDNLLSASPLFHLWLERPVLTMEHNHCIDIQNMDHIILECLSKENPNNRILTDQGFKYISLLEHVIDEKSQKSSFYRCAMYDVQDNEKEKVRIIRIAISKARKDELHVDQCEGLANLLGEYELPYVTEGQRTWPDGSLYLYMIGRNPNTWPYKLNEVNDLLIRMT